MRQTESTVIGGFLYWALLRCSSTSLGVTQITCWPFQYLTMLRDCRVLMMSFWVMLVIWLRSWIDNIPLKSRRISNKTQVTLAFLGSLQYSQA